VLSTDEFVAFAKKVVPFVHNTSRVDDEPYPNLLFEKGGNAFPTVAFLAADGKLLHQVPFEAMMRDGVAQFEASLSALQAWQRLKTKLGDQDSKELFLAEMELGMLPFAQARARFAELEGFDEGQKARLTQELIDLEFSGILRTLKRDNGAEVGKQFLAMLDADRIPKSRQITSFWQYIFVHAEAAGDVAVFERALERAKKEVDDERAARYLDSVEKRLERLREKVKGK
jgi:hypothetical protein